ncbi:PMS1 protein homolog 1 [Neosynchiropus ocellatus]
MKQLPPDTVRLLSSSQVITSVTNVVKELMENSLDAAASVIDVKLENYGLDRIELRDNGCGIKAADTAVMAVRHYTSKICNHEDLEHLETYGFRGEALGSICAVAEVAITTKTEDEDISLQYALDFKGNIVSQKPTHLGQGTTVSVQKLFKNLPVRRQYYSSTKKCKDELKKVQDLLTAYAIIKPELRVTFTHNKVVVWQKAKVPDHRSALVSMLGSSTVANLLPVHHHQEEPEILLDGLFPRPGADYSSTSSSLPDKTFIFVNCRPVHHKDIMKLLRQHYSAQYPNEAAKNRYPISMLKIAVSASSVDVNLTPDKTQVLLLNKESVLTAVEALLVSLYGFRPESIPQIGNELGDASATSTSTTQACGETRKDACPQISTLGNRQEDSANDELSSAKNNNVSLDRQTSNGSSSSSVAEDWIVNRNPAGLESTFSLCDDAQNQTTKEQEDSSRLVSDRREEQLSAEDWSKGTGLSDPVSGKPLQPVQIFKPSIPGENGPCGSVVKNVITEKRAALTAYDLISSRVVRAPLSPAALFEKEARAKVLSENPTASQEDINTTVQERWENLREEERKKFEEKAQKHLKHHEHVSKMAERTPKSIKRKAPLSNQQLLDELFSAQPQKKMKNAPQKRSQPLACSVAALRLRLQRLSSQSQALPQGPLLVNRLASQSAWVILYGQKLMLLNPFRVEETLLFKRLLENNVLPAVSLQNPIQLTDGNLGAENFMALCDMEQLTPELSGASTISDPRLVANGFKVTLSPGPASAPRNLEVTAMADCVPFLGVEDLREILTAVVRRKAQSVKECRPLKVTNYLQGEAVRLARQLPTKLSRDDVKDILHRMERQLGENNRTCFHGRAFLQPLCDLPETESEILALAKPLQV